MKQIVLNIRNGEKNTDIAFPCVEEGLYNQRMMRRP